MINATETETPTPQLCCAGKSQCRLIVPSRFELLIGGYFGTSYAVRLRRNGLWYNRYKHSESTKPADDGPWILDLPSLPAWRRFAAELDALNVWAWRRHYPNVSGVQDGYGFQFRIQYPHRQLLCSGDNAFPGPRGEAVSIMDRPAGDPFDDFCAAVSRLIGQPFR